MATTVSTIILFLKYTYLINTLTAVVTRDHPLITLLTLTHRLDGIAF